MKRRKQVTTTWTAFPAGELRRTLTHSHFLIPKSFGQLGMVVLIGLTGGIACGKSTVSKQLATAHNITIIDADDIVRQLQGPGTTCTRKIADIWPEVVSPTTGELNRALLGRIVFSDSNARRQLGRIMNKPIFLAILKAIFMAWWADILSRVGVGSGTAKRVVVLDAPTLFETRWFVPLVSNTVVVSCSPALQKQRLLARPNPLHQNARLSVEEAEDRIRSQMPLDLKKKMAGYEPSVDGAPTGMASGSSIRCSTSGWHRFTYYCAVVRDTTHRGSRILEMTEVRRNTGAIATGLRPSFSPFIWQQNCFFTFTNKIVTGTTGVPHSRRMFLHSLTLFKSYCFFLCSLPELYAGSNL
eukprot:gene8545-5992_t